MRENGIPELESEIRDELDNLAVLVSALASQRKRIPSDEELRSVFMESIALKLHNFYTGCERIFSKIANDLNGGLPQTPEWHEPEVIYSVD